jgi:hypothetical protein
MTEEMSALRLLRGLAIGVMPLASAAMIINSAVSKPMVPCSKSISTQSNPACAAISTICGDGIMIEQPSAGSPARSIDFSRFIFMRIAVR